MTFDHIKYKESQNIIPFCLQDKEKYYLDLMNIENSWTGRSDAMYSNDFFREAVQLIINSIVLFEKGYFDCALYSLRQSMEISTTIIYFVDNSEDKRESEMKKWRNQERFPMNNQMLKALENRKLVFSDIKEKMSLFFMEAELAKQKLNKYVHKQGLDKFYISRNHPLRKKEKDKLDKKLLADYNFFLIKSIGTIAVFRLAIDPFPLLLADDAIYKRTGQLLMTEGYSDAFIDKYIGQDNIIAYKQTDLYKELYDAIIKGEEMLPSVLDIVKNDYIDRSKIHEISSQVHLLEIIDIIAVALVEISEKISKIYCYGAWNWYFTNTQSKRISSNINSENFEIFNVSKKYNITYEEVFMSGMEISKENFYIEHNEKFNLKEIEKISVLVKYFNALTEYLQTKTENT